MTGCTTGFLWLTVQHMNSIGNRKIYSTPPRTYGVLGALRLARLVEWIRKRQADVPITIVCHSQGNMIGPPLHSLATGCPR